MEVNTSSVAHYEKELFGFGGCLCLGATMGTVSPEHSRPGPSLSGIHAVNHKRSTRNQREVGGPQVNFTMGAETGEQGDGATSGFSTVPWIKGKER